MRRCPKCGLLNASEVRHCDCGYDFLNECAPQSTSILARGFRGIGKVLAVVFTIILVALAGSFVRQVGSSVVGDTHGEASIESALKQVSSEINSSLPVMVDRETRLDSTAAGPGRRIIYAYTLVNVPDASMTQSDLRSGFNKVRNYVCRSDDMRMFVKENVEIVYRYHSADGSSIGDLVVTSADCS